MQTAHNLQLLLIPKVLCFINIKKDFKKKIITFFQIIFYLLSKLQNRDRILLNYHFRVEIKDIFSYQDKTSLKNF